MKTFDKRRAVMMGLVGFLFVIASIVSFSAKASAGTFPGQNGRILFNTLNGSARGASSIKPDGTDVKIVLSDTPNKTDTEYSPDGTKIVYIQSVSSVQQIFVANADGSNPSQITSGGAIKYTPSWSPDGTKIVYGEAVSSQVHIFRMNADGTSPTELTPSGIYYEPEYSPDGTKIIALFDSTDDEVVVMNADGTNVVNLTNNSVNDYRAGWSPNGTKIIYASDVGGSVLELFTMNADGSNKVQLTDDAVGYQSPQYSPDGTKISFIDMLAPSLLYTANADGTNITSHEVAWPLGVSWQPLTHKPSSATPNVTISVSNGKAVVNIAAMYTDVYAGIDSTSVTATSTPTAGTTSVDSASGVITYTPKTTAARSSFWSTLGSIFMPKVSAAPTDSFTYQVCSLANSNLCSTGTVTVNLLGAPATGAGQPNTTNYFVIWTLFALSATAIGLGIRKLRSQN